MEPLLILLVIGAFGGIVRSFIGYQANANETENFDYVKMARSMVRAAIVGVSIVLATTVLTGTEITTQTYVLAFMVSVGADTLTKETYKTVATP